MQEHRLVLTVTTLPPITLRERHVLIVIRTADGRYVLGGKKLYPPGIGRFVGGGIEAGEDPHLAAVRELEEEVQVRVSPTQLVPLLSIVATITAETARTGTHSQEPITFTTYLYFWDTVDQPLVASDDLDSLMYLSEPELHQLIRNYAQLSKEIDTEKQFAWFDYGQLYGPVHQLALAAIKQLDTQNTHS